MANQFLAGTQLSFEVSYDSNALDFVALKAYSYSSGAYSSVADVVIPMLLLDVNTNSYGCVFTPPHNRPYIVTKGSYTNSSYNISDGRFGGSEAFTILPADLAVSIVAVGMTVCVNPVTGLLTLQTWIDLNGTTITDPDSALIKIYDDAGTLVYTLGPDSSANAEGIFILTHTNVVQTLGINRSYLAIITIDTPSGAFTATRPFTVF